MGNHDDNRSSLNFNTVLLTLAVGMLGWNLKTTYETAVGQARIETKIASICDKEASRDAEIANIRTRLAAVEIEIAKLRR